MMVSYILSDSHSFPQAYELYFFRFSFSKCSLGKMFHNSSQVWEGDYHPMACNYSNVLDCHMFPSGRNYMEVTLLSNEDASITLHWADFFDNPETKYALIIEDEEGELVRVAQFSGQAFEIVFLPLGTYRIKVARVFGSPRFIHLGFGMLFPLSTHQRRRKPISFLTFFFFPFTDAYFVQLEFTTNGVIYGHPTADGAFAVAAVPHLGTTNFFTQSLVQDSKFESFTSLGYLIQQEGNLE